MNPCAASDTGPATIGRPTRTSPRARATASRINHPVTVSSCWHHQHAYILSSHDHNVHTEAAAAIDSSCRSSRLASFNRG